MTVLLQVEMKDIFVKKAHLPSRAETQASGIQVLS